jgi:hypothetical protein
VDQWNAAKVNEGLAKNPQPPEIRKESAAGGARAETLNARQTGI